MDVQLYVMSRGFGFCFKAYVNRNPLPPFGPFRQTNHEIQRKCTLLDAQLESLRREHTKLTEELQRRDARSEVRASSLYFVSGSSGERKRVLRSLKTRLFLRG